MSLLARHAGQPVRRRRPSSGRVGFVGPTADVETSAETSGFVFIRYRVKFHGPHLDDVFGVEVGDELVGIGQIGQGLPEGLKAGGAVIVIVSDGWEIDDPAVIGEAMARLSRLAHRVIWVNPRKAAVSYEPLVGGMAAALPYIDTFVPGHSIDALEEVLDAIRLGGQRPSSPKPRS